MIDSFLDNNLQALSDASRQSLQLEVSLARYDEKLRLNIDKQLEDSCGSKIEREKFLKFTFVDLFTEIDKSKFEMVFGAAKLNELSKKNQKQALICEILGNTHFCKPSGRINFKSLAKLRILQSLGYNVTYATNTDLKMIAAMDQASINHYVIELLKKNMNSF